MTTTSSTIRKDYMDHLTDRSGNPNVIVIHPATIGLCGKKNLWAAALLAQCIYWSDRTRDKDKWFYKSMKEWQEEIGITPRILRQALSDLDGIVETKKKMANGAPTLHYRVNVEKLYAETDKVVEDKTDSPGKTVNVSPPIIPPSTPIIPLPAPIIPPPTPVIASDCNKMLQSDYGLMEGFDYDETLQSDYDKMSQSLTEPVTEKVTGLLTVPVKRNFFDPDGSNGKIPKNGSSSKVEEKSYKTPPIPKPAKPSKHPAVVVYKRVRGGNRNPNKLQMDMIIETVTDLPLWEETIKYWLSHGWSTVNIASMLEVYKRGGPKSQQQYYFNKGRNARPVAPNGFAPPSVPSPERDGVRPGYTDFKLSQIREKFPKDYRTIEVVSYLQNNPPARWSNFVPEHVVEYVKSNPGQQIPDELFAGWYGVQEGQ